jgi:Ca2+-binding RTX toxin-like protein
MPNGIYDPRVVTYIRRITYNIVDAAEYLNVSANAVAGAIAGEYNENLNGDWGRQRGDNVVSILTNNVYSHRLIAANYEYFYVHNRGRKYTMPEKLNNPTANDLGPGNVNLGTAIDMLRAYQASAPSGDPLNLAVYYNDYARLGRDLENPVSGATEKFAALVIQRAEAFYASRSDWASRSVAEREALAIWYYNVGERLAQERYDAAKAKWRAANPDRPESEFVFHPNLPTTFGPEGVQEHLANRGTIINALATPSANTNIAIDRPTWAVLVDAPLGVPGWDAALLTVNSKMQPSVVAAANYGQFYTWFASDNSGYSISLTKIQNGSSYYVQMVETVGVDGQGRATQIRTSRLQPLDPANPSSEFSRTSTVLENVNPVTGERTFVMQLTAEINDLPYVFALKSERTSGWRVAYRVLEATDDGGTIERQITHMGRPRPSEPAPSTSEESGEGEEIIVTGTRIRNSMGALLSPPATEYAVYNQADDPTAAVHRVRMAGDIGAIFGSTLGRQIVGSNVFAQLGASTLFGAIGRSLGESIDSMLQGVLPAAALRDGFSRLDSNILNGGIGAISALLVGELLAVVGLEGIPAEVAQSTAGHAVSSIAKNILSENTPFHNLDLASFGNVIGSLAGSMLAAQVVKFDTVGGQIGASLGASVGSILAGSLLVAGNGAAATLIGLKLGFLAGPLGAALGAFVGYIAGGMIGSLFGGTPRSSADVSWDAQSETFAVTNVTSKKGGSKDVARGLADAAANTYNGVLSAIGGTLVNASDVRSGSFGMRKKEFVYWSSGPTTKNSIDARSDDAASILDTGIYNGLSDMRIAGGNVFVKRALTNHLNLIPAGSFSTEALVGDITIAQDYSVFNDNGSLIGSLILAQPESTFAAGWMITLARAWELGLHRRGEMDWEGGFNAFLQDFNLSAAQLAPSLAPGSRLEREFLTTTGLIIADTIATTETTLIGGNSGDDIIDLRSNQWAGEVIEVAAAVSAGGGNDIVHASGRGDTIDGGVGDDTLYGGRLDDWLLGGDGIDTIHAGDEDGNFAGDGNYLDGGAGNDTLHGGEGSDWLEGAAGDDVVEGGGGEDILSGGTGHDILRGGAGGDTYLIRAGDENDEAEDVITAQVVNTIAAPDPVKERFAQIAAGTLAKNWRGDAGDLEKARGLNRIAEEAAELAAANGVGTGVLAAPVAIAPVEAAGEDSIVFGAGIELGDVRITRAGGANGADLLIQLTKLNAAGTDQEPTGTELLVKDWFVNPFKRIEWLKFADGTEVRIGDFTSFVAGTAAGDVLIGTSGDDFVVAGAGDDQLHLLTGNDVGNGGTGNDLVAGDGGSDLLLGGLGDDTLLGGGERDAISGDGGADDLYGGSGDDILSGGKGDDHIAGGQGNDVFKYMRGDGRDTVMDEFSNNWVTVWSAAGSYGAGFTRHPTTGEITAADGTFIYKNVGTPEAPDYRWLGRFDYDSANGVLYRFDHNVAASANVVNSGTDTIEFGIGIDIQDVILTRASATSPDLVLTISQEDAELTGYLASTDSITIKNWYTVPGQIEKLAFYQTGTLAIGPGGINLVAGTDLANGTSFAPLAGTSAADWITGGAGDDVVAGGGGDDILNGNSGFDTLRGEAGKDVLYGGAGNDILDGGDASTTLFSADMLFGGAGIDTVTYASVNAKVRAYLGAAWANAGAAVGDQYFDVENLTGSTWGASIPTPGSADVLGGDAGDNEITGGRGDDTMMGGAGNDTYMWNGAEWSDVIREGAFTVEQAVDLQGKLVDGFKIHWSDTGLVWDEATGQTYMKLEVANAGGETVYSWDKFAFSAAQRPAVTAGFVAPAAPVDASGWDQRGWGASGYSRTNGQQVTREKFDTSADGGHDTIEFGAGLSLTDYIFVRCDENGVADDNGNSLIIRYQSSGIDYMLIKNHYTSWGAVESLQFRDGLSVSLANLLIAETGATLAGTAGDDFISALGATSSEHLLGLAGNDVLSGLKGIDWLEGGDGDDTLEGGSGADTLDGGAHSAPVATPAPDPANPNAVLKPIVTPHWGDTVRYAHSLSGINVDLRKTTGQLGGDAAGDILIGIENVVGSTLADTISGDDGANRIDGLDGANTIHGWGGDDILVAGSGADFLYGDDGDDGISGAEGIDNLYGGDGNDRIDGGTGNDKLWGEDGDDILTAGDGDDSLVDGGLGEDQVLGQNGNDILFGGGGDDLIVGGAGNDTMDGGGDNDRYLIERGSGTDTITDTHGVNTLQFKDARFDQLWLTQSGSDLLVRVVGTTDSVKLLNFFSGGGRLHAIQTSTHILFVDHVGTQALIDAMQAATGYAVVPGTTTPLAMPANIGVLLGQYWHAGDKAAPLAPAAATLAGPEDLPIAFAGDWGVVDHDSNLVGYSVKPGSGPAHGSVQITNAATGALTYTPHPNYNGADSFILIARDADNQSVEFTVAVTVGPVADAPEDIRTAGSGPLEVAEAASTSGTATGTAVGQLLATDPEGNAISWSLADAAEGRFAITTNGLLYVNDASLLDHEAAAEHVVRVRATDSGGAWREQDFTVRVGDVNEQNSLAPIAPMSIDENSAIGALVGTVPAAIDPDTGEFGEQRFYFLNDGTPGAVSSDGRYRIDPLTGAIRTETLLDYEEGTPQRTYVVLARDSAGKPGFTETSGAVTIAVQDRNDPVAFGPVPPLSVAENTAVGTVVGAVPAASDPDGSGFGTLRYFFLNGSAASSLSHDGRYAISEQTGVVTVNSALNFEDSSPARTYTVGVRDNGGAPGYTQATADLTISIDDANEQNALPAIAPMSVAEGVAPGTVVGTVPAATDPDGAGVPFGQQRYYFRDGTTANAVSFDGRYRIDGESGIITVEGPLDYETEATGRTYTIVARDNAGQPGFIESASDVTIAIIDGNEQNALGAIPAMSIDENVAPGTVVGGVPPAADPDSPEGAFGQQRYYFWDGAGATGISADGQYRIDEESGVIVVNGPLDHEAGSPGRTYTIAARDNAGQPGYTQATSTGVISVNDLNEQNALGPIPAMAVDENAAPGTLVGTVPPATDPDGAGVAFGQQRYYFWDVTAGLAVSTSADGRFAIDAATGAITTAAALDYEAGTPSGNYVVVVRDNAGAPGYNQATSNVTIVINNLNEQNALGAIPAMTVAENAAPGMLVGTVPSATDPDAPGTAFADQRYLFWDSATSTASATSSDGRYAINATTGQITAAGPLDYEAGAPSKTYTVAVRDNGGAPGYNQATSNVTIGITDLNEKNALGPIPAMGVDENVPVGTVVGAVPAAIDPDGAGTAFADQRYFFWNVTNATASAISSDGRYAIDAATGQITTAAALDYESGMPSKTYTIAARDNGGAAGFNQANATVTIGVNNVNEQNAFGAIGAMNVNENAAPGMLVGTVPPATDHDAAGTAFADQRYYFWDAATSSASAISSDGRYAINAATGQITTAEALNYEAGSPIKTYAIAARDNGGAPGYTQATSNVTIAINNLNEQNALGPIAAMAVDENSAPGALVGIVPPGPIPMRPARPSPSSAIISGTWPRRRRARPRRTAATRSTRRRARSRPRLRSTTKGGRRARPTRSPPATMAGRPASTSPSRTSPSASTT